MKHLVIRLSILALLCSVALAGTLDIKEVIDAVMPQACIQDCQALTTVMECFNLHVKRLAIEVDPLRLEYDGDWTPFFKCMPDPDLLLPCKKCLDLPDTQCPDSEYKRPENGSDEL